MLTSGWSGRAVSKPPKDQVPCAPLNRSVGPLSSVMNETTIALPARSHRLYSVGQITFATWGASPLAGCLLLSSNYRVLQRSGAARQSLLWGVLSTILLFAFTFSLAVPRMVLPVVCACAMWPLASYLQSDAIKDHLAAGGKKGSWWVTVGLSVGIVLLFIVVGVCGLLLYRYLTCAPTKPCS